MSNVLTLGAAQKAAADKVRLAMDWGNEPAIIELLVDSNGNYDSTATAITAYDVTVSGAGAPTVSGVQLDYPYQTSALFTGGTAGTYNVVYTVTVNDGDGTELSRTGTLEVL